MSDPQGAQHVPLVVGVGEILWDLLPAGQVLGGAPANFACQARRLGARAALISATGADTLGEEARHRLQSHGVDASAVVTVHAQPTGTVDVELGPGGEPAYSIAEPVAWDFMPVTPWAMTLARSTDAICFGSLALRRPVSRATIHAVIDAASSRCLRVFDVNLRPPWIVPEVVRTLLERANVVKMNDSELQAVTKMLDLHGGEAQRIEDLAALYQLRLVAVTKGSAGCRLFAGGQHVAHPGCPVRQVVDTVGAGDAFTAAMVLCLCHDLPLEVIAETSNRVASSACRQSGAFASGAASIGRVS